MDSLSLVRFASYIISSFEALARLDNFTWRTCVHSISCVCLRFSTSLSLSRQTTPHKVTPLANPTPIRTPTTQLNSQTPVQNRAASIKLTCSLIAWLLCTWPNRNGRCFLPSRGPKFEYCLPQLLTSRSSSSKPSSEVWQSFRQR